MKCEGNIIVAQGGGPTAVINQSLVGVVLEARKFLNNCNVYGAVNGVEGIINEEFLNLTYETTNNLEQVAKTPSSALFSTRDKPDEKYCMEILKVLKAHDARYFFYIGGNDSADTMRIVNEYAQKELYNLKAVHIPKTIDNDIMVNDHTPGYGSAARFVVNAFAGANLDNRALPGVYIGVVMGRDSGFLTASSAIAKKYADDGPHLIYLPERAFNMENFLSDVNNVYKKYGRCVIAVSEGIRDEAGVPIIKKLVEKLETDAHGNIQLSGNGALGDMLANYIKKNLNIKRVRSDTFGYIQRCFVECTSDVDQREAREVGEKAVQFSIYHNSSGSVTIHRTGDYSVDYKLTNLNKVAGKAKEMSSEFINIKGNDVTEKFKNYVRPLIGSDLQLPHRLRAPKVEKILKK
jgi:6-phosphofructokinase 1